MYWLDSSSGRSRRPEEGREAAASPRKTHVPRVRGQDREGKQATAGRQAGAGVALRGVACLRRAAGPRSSHRMAILSPARSCRRLARALRAGCEEGAGGKAQASDISASTPPHDSLRKLVWKSSRGEAIIVMFSCAHKNCHVHTHTHTGSTVQWHEGGGGCSSCEGP